MAIITTREDGITTILIDRAAVRNCVNHETALELREAFRTFDEDGSQKVAVLGGVGGCFCAGYDLKEAADGAGALNYEPEGEGPMGPTRMLLDKPVIAAVDGYAVAGGLELALWCDMRVMEEDATFGVFCRRWGVPLIDGGTVRLPRLIGQSRALDMILTGRAVGAEEAMAWGLANRVVAKGRAHEAATELAREIARFPEICMRADRRSAHEQWGLDLGEALNNEGRGGLKPLMEETAKGAARFRDGKGRGGDFGTI
ncbi:MAG: enoyl-CoA hydratase [Rhizobiales bacterium NRL2]|jgi:enoyl-CoA hydratase|nr:MAG: enoyl-CoA hydratase [Rhizobiales bacterium NRL2]